MHDGSQRNQVPVQYVHRPQSHNTVIPVGPRICLYTSYVIHTYAYIHVYIYIYRPYTYMEPLGFKLPATVCCCFAQSEGSQHVQSQVLSKTSSSKRLQTLSSPKKAEKTERLDPTSTEQQTTPRKEPRNTNINKQTL